MYSRRLREIHFSKCRLDVAQFMSPLASCLNNELTLEEGLRKFVEAGTHILPLVDEQGGLLGTIDMRSVVARLLDGGEAGSRLSSLMANPAVTCPPNTHMGDMIESVQKYGTETVVVVSEKGAPIGMITPRDLVGGSIMQVGDTLDKVIAVLESVYNGILVVDYNGIITCFNRTAERVFNKKAREVIGTNVASLLPESRLNEVLSTGETHVNQRCQINDLTILMNRAPINRQGYISGAVATFQDITEFENISEELDHVKKLKTTLETVIENPFEGVVVVDDQGIVTLVNQTYLDMLGRSKGEVVGRHIRELTPESQLPNILESGETRVGEVWKVNDQEMLVTRGPIIKDGKVIGAIKKTLFTDMHLAKLVARKLVKVENELETYKQELKKMYTCRYTIDDLVGDSEVMVEFKRFARRAALSRSTVLITGESGTGKEVVAHAIHRDSHRQQGPFIKVNCAAIPEPLLESELFGYEEGAFTGAKKRGKPGKFELAHQGTIFLDEIGDMPPAMQAKLLRVLQEREFERLGGTETIRVDTRVIAATNRKLLKLVQAGQFREDLYYRLNVISLEVPPLRERMEDLEMLIDYILQRLNQEIGATVSEVSPEVLDVFHRHDWPGNIRELENVLERCLNTVDGHIIRLKHLPTHLRKLSRGTPPAADANPSGRTLAEMEKWMIFEALRNAQGNKSVACKVLNIPRSVLYRKLHKYGIT
ncbi:MAG: sigma-54-dependent Fis family transcriptional regulator [Firmicutes bacterium]|nr:sigma-54-dependent Fis family transcriptional regulator [Bacillota bacterium]